jgi:protein SCO1
MTPCWRLKLLALVTLATTAAAQEVRVPPPGPEPLRVQVPDVQLVDQQGRTVRLWSDLMRGQVVVIHSFFTRCKTICSPMAATLSRVRKELGPGSPVRFISLSLDAANDTPERLASFAAQFSPDERWWLLTGEVEQMKQAQVALGSYASDKEAHTPRMLVGNALADKWVRVEGLGSPKALLEAIREVQAASAAPAELKAAPGLSQDKAAARYFTNTELVDQQGKVHRFYEDLIRGRTVLINFAFTSCKGACSPITKHLAEVQARLGDRVGRDVFLLTLSVDPTNDTPATLSRFAKKFGARKGWYFLTGSRENMKRVLERLGGYTEDPNNHNTTLLIGDAATGVWVKSPALARTDAIVHAVEHLNEP